MDRPSAIFFLDDTYRTLNDQTDLSPDNRLVTQRLHGLVATLRDWHAKGIHGELADAPELLEARCGLPSLCAVAECAMEKWWCRKALAGKAPERVLEDFWYMDNYRSLCRAECNLVGPDIGRDVVFLGCGALPLSAILLARANANMRLICVDADAEACDLATALVRAIGLDGRICVDHGRAEDYFVASDAIIICASLLDAPGLPSHLAACGTARLLVRDVEGVYRWLYSPAKLLGPAFRECARTAPSSERINISRYFRAVGDPGRAERLVAGLANA